MMNHFETIDRESLNILQHLVGNEFPSVIGRYLNDSEYYIQEMDLAFKKASYGDLYQLAHTLKGSSGTLSANRLHDICAELEQRAMAPSSFGQLAQLLNAIESEFQQVKTALMEYLESSVANEITASVLPSFATD